MSEELNNPAICLRCHFRAETPVTVDRKGMSPLSPVSPPEIVKFWKFSVCLFL